MRYADWQSRFWAEMDRQRSEPFVWGTRDCILFAARMGDAISDAGYVARARDAFSWSDAKEASAHLKDTDLRVLVETQMGPMVRWVELCMGDFALVLDDKGRESLGVHDGVQILGPAEIGVKPIPFRYVVGGWHVT